MLGFYNKLSSEIYDMDKPIGHSFGDVEFYKGRLSTCTGKILEPATGTGRMLIPLIESGLDVEGFDISSDMLTICRSNCKNRGLNPRLFEAKMESFSSKVKYDSIILPTGTFLLLYKRKQSLAALENFYRHLKDGGRLILDMFLQPDIPIGNVFTREWELENGDVITLEEKNVEVDYINQYKVSHLRYEKWSNSTLIQTELERFPLRWYGVEEFKLILEKIGFSDIIISSDYKLGQYPVTAEQIITFEAVAEK